MLPPRLAPLATALVMVGAGCSAGAPGDTASAPSMPAAVADCAGDRTLSCTFYDATTKAWTLHPPQTISLVSACGDGGMHGEIAAFVDTGAQYWLDRIGFEASGSAVRTPNAIASNDDVGGATYGCGRGGGPVITQLFCGRAVSTGTLALHFAFSGRWSDGSTWRKDCEAMIEVVP